MPSNEMIKSTSLDEARRMMEICNACRYCEGYCAVFPAMELRREFTAPDLTYLANLCHNCRDCYYACQFAPPHEFAVNVPEIFADLRVQSYAAYAWPQSFAGLYRRAGTWAALALAGGLALVLVLAVLLQDAGIWAAAHTGEGAFYAVIPKNIMVGVAGAAGLFVLLSLLIGFMRFLKGAPAQAGLRPGLSALADVLTMENLKGGGAGCNFPGEKFSAERRWLHHFVMYGFFAAFAATTVAAFYDHVLGREAPYAYFSLPVILGTLGGTAMVVGCLGLMRQKLAEDKAPAYTDARPMEWGFIWLLLLTSATGLLLLAMRETTMMGVLLAAHLGVVLALFVTLPYGKFVHGVYRFAALIIFAAESKAHKQTKLKLIKSRRE
ncbi:MAG: tricarballylate utilization 4Fe-4S protein TcuB [Rhodospirillales bacterium]|nr:tricarballylate utilization 4Fe-4S protein TcuB [Rhodospirillales bacterium]